MKRTRKKRGFTLMELMVTTIAISVLAALAVPNYNKAIEKNHFRQARTNLKTLKAAAEIYRARNGKFGTNGLIMESLSDINAFLGTSISDSHFSYLYIVDGGTLGIFLERNDYDNSGFDYRLEQRLEYSGGPFGNDDTFTCYDDCSEWYAN